MPIASSPRCCTPSAGTRPPAEHVPLRLARHLPAVPGARCCATFPIGLARRRRIRAPRRSLPRNGLVQLDVCRNAMLRPAAGGCPGGAGAASSPRRPSSGVPANACLLGRRNQSAWRATERCSAPASPQPIPGHDACSMPRHRPNRTLPGHLEDGPATSLSARKSTTCASQQPRIL